MKKLRWAMEEGGFWETDMSTPRTLEGEARAVAGETLPLGLSRGERLSRPKQIDFFQRFMAAPFLPSYSPPPHHGFSLQRLLPLPFFPSSWFTTLLAQFNLQKFASSLKKNGALHPSQNSSSSSRWDTIKNHLRDPSLYALGLCSELSLTPDDTLLFSSDLYGDPNIPTRYKAVFHHKACRPSFLSHFSPLHNLMAEAVWPGLFADQAGNYWDVPFSWSIDLGSAAPQSEGPSYHLSMHQNSGCPKQLDFQGHQSSSIPPALLPGISVKTAFAFKKNFHIWRSKAPKLKRVQPFDLLLSNPHISASAIIGAAASAYFGDNSVRSQPVDEFPHCQGLRLHSPATKSALLADLFSSVSFTAQHGNFQRLFLDLTRVQARLDISSGSKFVSSATRIAQDLLNSQQPNFEAVQAICPAVTLSLQQQIAGPFSFRADCGVAYDWKNRDLQLRLDDPVFAIEYALHVLGSAKATAWYSPKQREFMMELRFFET
ncbi:hypothetical protein Tsubulata_033320 [Turnera subulata]|uniref:Protein TRIGALACTOSYLDIACYLGLYCEROL 4, chloroplastic n=1 Tax=Turnera subulata TaxID=218843 RepID=A0A9Q0FSY5_9ROSI|nr:hypothetical protein Tsubulata_033320 [Turnera subulata]